MAHGIHKLGGEADETHSRLFEPTVGFAVRG
jgi:hypothetical protein